MYSYHLQVIYVSKPSSWHILISLVSFFYLKGHRDGTTRKTIRIQKNEEGSYQDYLKYQGLEKVREHNKDI
jgi:hypothetical protein